METMRDMLAAMRGELERRSRELNEAVRAYPSPIARCDDQLAKLLAQRDAAARNLKRADEFIATLELED
jgi:hypothetical protein